MQIRDAIWISCRNLKKKMKERLLGVKVGNGEEVKVGDDIDDGDRL